MKLERSVLQIVVVVITLLLATGAGLAQRTDCAADVDYVEQAHSASAQGNLEPISKMAAKAKIEA